MNILDKEVSEADLGQIPQTIDALTSSSAGKISLSRRITSVRPGDLVRVNFSIPADKTETPDFSEIIAAVYSTKNGSLVHVLSQAPALQVSGLRDAEYLGGRDVALHLPVSGLPDNREFVIYKLALIAPEKDPSGLWTKYSADTMLLAFDGAS
ncbi:hypothetical protein GGI15_000324 [Coemansia interrupta]|uniref:Uncharacterized protein n=1 Tax=Coemansia interrupta TaxID=1126814 RepID=A0A9W8HPU1_9FUNG|nr:hypothetical protein GGI15_000324 [Coemansia interrupta]